MELENYKSAWRQQSGPGPTLSTPRGISRSLQFLRTSAIRDMERSEEVSRLVFCLLFALVAVGASFLVMTPGIARVGAWLFGAALVADGLAGTVLLARRLRQPATATMLEFICRERDHAAIRVRLEKYSQVIMISLAVLTLLLLMIAPHPTGLRENALDALQRMAVVTAFLAVAWLRAKSRSPEVRRELDRYLKDLE